MNHIIIQIYFDYKLKTNLLAPYSHGNVKEFLSVMESQHSISLLSLTLTFNFDG